MKIDPKQVAGSPEGTPSVTPGRRGRTASAASAGADELILTSRAEEFRRVRPQLDALPESRQERIEQLRARLREDAYQVSGEDIADAMLRDESTVGLLHLGRP